MSLGFYCVSNAQGYILTIPSLRDIWGQPCTWLGSPSPHSTRVIPADSMGNPELVHLLTTERLVLDPKSHALQFREDINILKAQYAKELGERYAHPVAGTAVPTTVAPTAEELAAEEARALAEAQAVADAEASEAAAKAAEEAAAKAAEEAAAKAAEEAATKAAEEAAAKAAEEAATKAAEEAATKAAEEAAAPAEPAVETPSSSSSSSSKKKR